jgi:oligopeptide/dipeptide ABC transporter ATP-binding protein
MSENALMTVKNLKVYFPVGKKGIFHRQQKMVKAVDDVSLSIFPHETLGLVGESGCGKSTFGRSLLRLTEPTFGTITYDNQDIISLNKEQMRQMRQKLQMIFQDPYATLNPRMTVSEIIRSPLDAFQIGSKEERMEKTRTMLKLVGLNEKQLDRYPHEFSGGQRQRIVIARALVLNPEFIVCDEPVSALDVSVRSQVLNLMKELQDKLHFTYLFISHDLSVVRHISTRVAVMYLGKMMELADTETLYSNPKHPYTKALLSAIPIADPTVKRERIILSGDVPNPISPPKGCRFCTRCKEAVAECFEQEPKLREVGMNHFVACHQYGKTGIEYEQRKEL